MILRKLSPLLLCVFALTVPLAVSAQQPDSGAAPPMQQGPPPGPPGPQTAAQELARLDHALTLTDAQKSAILPILEKRRTDMAALRQNSSEGGGNREQMRTLMESSRAAVRAQLTEAQQKTYDNMRPGRGGRPGPRGSDGTAPPPPPPGEGAPPTPSTPPTPPQA